MKKILNYLLVLVLISTILSPVSAQASKAKAIKSSQKVELDGKEVNLPAYLINDYNYIKLRDYAATLNQSSNKFNVEYDAAKKAVIIKNNESYKVEKDDLKAITKDNKEALLSDVEIIVNGKPTKVECANIDGYNYLKIRPLSKLVGVAIDYDAKTRTVIITTNKENKKPNVENKEKNYKCENGACHCKHKSMEDMKKCDCCGDKNIHAKDNKENVDIYNCGCNCKHKSVEECQNCPCCKGRSIYKNGQLFMEVRREENNVKIEENITKKENNKVKNEENNAKVEENITKEEKTPKMVKKTAYKCSDKCGCVHPDMNAYNACPCCKGKTPIPFEVEVEEGSTVTNIAM